jgi:hypothetical protein
MAELKKLFVGAKMDKDSDERLVEAGNYTDALNIDIISAEGGDAGVVRNKPGNILASTDYNFTNATTIGIYKNTSTERIYLFVTADEGDYIIEYNALTSACAQIVVDTNGILNWNAGMHVTGIQMIESELGWVVYNREPCVINVKDAKQYTRDNGTITLLSQVSMIQPSPLDAPNMVLQTSARGGIISATTNKNFTATQANNGALAAGPLPGDGVIFEVPTGTAFLVGDKLKLTAPTSLEDAFEGEYEINIVVVTTLAGGSHITGSIINASTTIEDNVLLWEVALIDEKPLYELVFPRFAYRWKYNNNQYSTVSPFTSVAFLPGEFEFNSNKGFNTGMTNNVRKIALSVFNNNMPATVEEIDILVKMSDSPTIYVVDTIDADETEFVITKENIRNPIDQIQLLRPFDAVPTSAVALEAVSNRFVLGNYKKGRDVEEDVIFEEALVDSTAVITVGEPEQSIKSLRTYQGGVVFQDGQGRQTPVLSSQTGVVTTDNSDATSANSIKFKMGGIAPAWATHFKYFLKDTAPSYYNLAADRLYQSEDKQTTWLSFPSSERNKLTEETYLIAKKKHDVELAVTAADNRFKVLDIQSEVPEELTIKKAVTNTSQILFDTNFGDGNEASAASPGATPVPNSKVFLIASDREVANYGCTSILMDEMVKGKFIRFTNGAGSYSKYYKIASILKSRDEPARYFSLVDISLIHIKVHVTEPFGDDVNFLYDNPVGANPVLVNNRVTMEISETQPVADQEQFSGRFFVKLASSIVLDSIFPVTEDYVTLHSANCYLGGYINGDVNFKIHAGGASPRLGYSVLNTLGGLDIDRNPMWADDDVNDVAYDIVFEKRSRRPLDEEMITAINTEGTKIKFSNHDTIYTIEQVRARTVEYQSANYTRYWVKFDKVLEETVTPHLLNANISFEVVGLDVATAFTSSTPAVFETEIEELVDFDIYHEASNAFPIAEFNNLKTLDYYNCFSFGNGVESNRIRDDFNAVIIDKGPKVSTILDEPIAEEHVPNGMIFSGIYNSIGGVNNLNQFTIAEKITKELNPLYGSIQKLHARNTDLIVLCEDKVLQVLANKDALYNADGSTNVAISNNVLGSVRPYAGEFGISYNPESFATYGFRSYFTDKRRGAVLRLSMDGITPITYGYQAELEGLFKDNNYAVGSYDDSTEHYNLTIGGQTHQYSEQSKGWTSRWGVNPEAALTINNTYYTSIAGKIWKHTDLVNRNSWYGNDAAASSVTFVYNDAPSVIKKFKTLAYEGDAGWTTPSIETAEQSGTVPVYVEKEGKHFNYIKGVASLWDNNTQTGNIDSQEFNVQGIGAMTGIAGDVNATEFTITVFDDPTDH